MIRTIWFSNLDILVESHYQWKKRIWTVQHHLQSLNNYGIAWKASKSRKKTLRMTRLGVLMLWVRSLFLVSWIDVMLKWNVSLFLRRSKKTWETDRNMVTLLFHNNYQLLSDKFWDFFFFSAFWDLNKSIAVLFTSVLGVWNWLCLENLTDNWKKISTLSIITRGRDGWEVPKLGRNTRNIMENCLTADLRYWTIWNTLHKKREREC